MLKHFFFSKRVDDLNYKSIASIYLFLLLFVIILSSIYCYLTLTKFDYLTDENLNIIFEGIQFEYGKLIYNIYHDFNYSFVDDDGILYFLKRLPVFPTLIVIISKISKNIFFIFILKNIIIFSILFVSIIITLRSLKIKIYFLFVLLLPFIIPYNLHVILNIFFADNIVAILLPSIFILLFSKSKKKYFLISIFLFLLYLTKNSSMFIVMFLPFLIILLEKDNLLLKSLPLLGCVAAILVWGLFGTIKTGKFPFGSSILTSNTKVLNEVVFNDDFKKIYPKKSVDLLPQSKIPNNIKHEWEVYEYFKTKNKNYLKNNFNKYLLDIPIKIKFIFFNIRKDSVFPLNGIYENPIIISHIINRAIFNLSIIICSFLLIKNFIKKLNIYNQKNDVYFIGILISSLFPNIIGWATSKHLVGIQIISAIYLLFKFYDFYKKNTIKI